MSIEIIDKNHRIVRRSKNLRGVVTHNRLHGKPKAWFCANFAGGCAVHMEWANGDWGSVEFQSDYVAWRWFEKRASERVRVIGLGQA